MVLEMHNWNQLKISILKTVKKNPVITANDLAKALGITTASVQMALIRYARQGLVSRTKRPSGYRKAPFLYGLITRGNNRLAHLEKD